jgi:hypothetical protein
LRGVPLRNPSWPLVKLNATLLASLNRHFIWFPQPLRGLVKKLGSSPENQFVNLDPLPKGV